MKCNRFLLLASGFIFLTLSGCSLFYDHLHHSQGKPCGICHYQGGPGGIQEDAMENSRYYGTM